MSRVLGLLALLAGASAAMVVAVQFASRAPSDGTSDASIDAASVAQPWTIDWKGYIRAGPADMFSHTLETEGLVAPLAKMGFNAEVPEGTSMMEFALKWPPGTKMHVMAHGPHDAGMPTYMGEWPDSGEACIRVPAKEIIPGTWKVMSHSDETAINLDFTITLRAAGPTAPIVLEGLHGHPGMGAMDMQMRVPEPCED